MFKQPTPEWFKHIAPDGLLNAKDFIILLGIPTSTFWLYIKNGKLPPPDTKHLVGDKLGGGKTFTNRALWRVSTVKRCLNNAKGLS